MNEDKATRYHRLGRRARILSTLWTSVILIGLLVLGASASLREWASSIAVGSPTLVVALYVLVLSLLFDAATLPFSVYRGFLLEQRYGLATETIGHWLKDHAKAVVIGVLFAEAAAVFVYFTLRHWPGSWWVLAGLGYALVTIVLVNLAPVVLLPLFFTFKPLQKDALRDRLTALASKAGTHVMGVYEWTLSDRTKKANAALAGIGHTRRILLSDTLLAEYSDDEIEVILAHELAHHVHRDIWSSVVFDILLDIRRIVCGAPAVAVGCAVFPIAGCCRSGRGAAAGADGWCDRPVRASASERDLTIARAACRFVCAADDREPDGVHHRHEAPGPAESCRRQSVAVRAGVFLHASADQRAAQRRAKLDTDID